MKLFELKGGLPDLLKILTVERLHFEESCECRAHPTCALGEAWYVRVGKGVLTLEGLGQHAQSRAADDGHLGAVLCVRQQPIGCLLVLVVTADR